MKLIGKIAAVFGLFALLFVQINLHVVKATAIEIPIENQYITTVENLYVIGLHDIEGHTNVVEIFFNSFSSNTHFLQKKYLKDFIFFTKSFDRLFVSKIQQYTFISFFQIEGLQTTDIIFPFHYFF